MNIFQFNESRELKNKKRIENVNLDDTTYRFVGNKLCINYKDDADEKYYLRILDDNLKTLRTIELSKTLVGANRDYIYCLCDENKESDCAFFVYNWSLEIVRKFGQRTNPNKSFYFPKYCLQILDLTSNHKEYFVSYISDFINIIDKQSGMIVKCIEKNAHKLEIDSQNNIISFNRRSFTYFNLTGRCLKEAHIIDFPKNNTGGWSLDKNDNLFYFDPEKFYLSI